MNKWLDSPMHSVASGDEKVASAGLVKKCVAAGLRAVALPDHNFMRGGEVAGCLQL